MLMIVGDGDGEDFNTHNLGHRTYNCDASMTVKDCTKEMVQDSIAFHTYTEFFTHSSAM